MTFKVIIELSPGLPCPGAIHDLSQRKWVAILLNVVKDYCEFLHIALDRASHFTLTLLFVGNRQNSVHTLG